MSDTDDDGARPRGNKSYSTGHSKIGLDELNKSQYTYGVAGQASRYTKTTKIIGEYVRIAYGKSMWLLVHSAEESKWTEPDEPDDSASRAAFEKYRMKLSENSSEEKRYCRHKAQVFGIIMGRCHPTMKSKVEELPDFGQMEQTDDVISLLLKLKGLAFGNNNTQYEFWTLQATIKVMMTMQQGKTETLNNFSKRFLAQQEVTEEMWGPLIPNKLSEGKKNDKTNETARNKFFACLFLSSVNRERYKQAIMDLNNDYVHDSTTSYPEDVPNMLALLNNRKEDNETTNRPASTHRRGGETSFAQGQPQRKCKHCRKKGHYAHQCPNQGNDTSDSESDETPNTGRVGWHGYQVEDHGAFED